MEGHVRKRGDKWYYSFEAASIGGKRKRIERVGGKTKKEAESALRKAIEEYNNSGQQFNPTEISVADYLDYWFKNYVLLNCKYNTQNGYSLIIKNHLKPILGSYKLKALTPTTIQQFINDKYLTRLSKNHLKNIMAVLNSALKYAVHPCKLIKENPMQYVRFPRYEYTKEEVDHKIISSEELTKILERFPEKTTFYIPILIGYYTGCRIGEVMGLTWDKIDFQQEQIHITHLIYKRDKNWCFGTPKTKTSIRTIKIGKTLVHILKKHKRQQLENQLKYRQYYTQQYIQNEVSPQNEKYTRIFSLQMCVTTQMQMINMVCTKENGEMVTPDTFRYASRVINYSLGIPFNFHSLRHTHATTLIENGAIIKDVQERLGHASIETTLNTYTHTTEKSQQLSVDIFEQATSQK